MNKSKIYFIILLHLICITGCNSGDRASERATSQTLDLSTERNAFTTQLTTTGPSPQPYENETPPMGVEEVYYSSGNLKLKAWVSKTIALEKRPAVVFLHGGWAFSSGDWRDASPFINAGFIVLMPMLRGENGNPGNYEAFWGEVNDAVAAGEFAATLPNVDPNNIFLAGHSVGGILTVLTSMVPSRYKAAASLSGYLDMGPWIAEQPDVISVFDQTNEKELRLRNPMEFISSLKIPLKLYSERGEMADVNREFQKAAKSIGLDCELKVVNGDHMSMVAPAVRDAIKWFKGKIKK